MTDYEFVNRIRSLYNIDAHYLPELSERDWPQFRDNPPRYLINRADKTQITAILREIEKRQRNPRTVTERDCTP